MLITTEMKRWVHLARSGFAAFAGKKNFPFQSYNKFFIDQACLIKMALSWPRSFRLSFLSTLTSIRLGQRRYTEEEANIQSS